MRKFKLENGLTYREHPKQCKDSKIMKKILSIMSIAGIILFGTSILIYTTLTYVWAFSPYSLEMYKCMIKNLASIVGCCACVGILLKTK